MSEFEQFDLQEMAKEAKVAFEARLVNWLTKERGLPPGRVGARDAAPQATDEVMSEILQKYAAILHKDAEDSRLPYKEE